MSIENNSRPYRKKERARQQEETRRRITEAIVELHQSVGPANTTVSEVAERAGVGRMTVYKHFPTDVSLFAACSAHWSAENPMPNFTDCLAREDFGERVEAVLRHLYGYYEDNTDMLGNIMRDAPSMPALQEVMNDGWYSEMRALAKQLLPTGLKTTARMRALAALSIVLDYRSWESMLDSGLSVKEAAKLGARMVSAAISDSA